MDLAPVVQLVAMRSGGPAAQALALALGTGEVMGGPEGLAVLHAGVTALQAYLNGERAVPAWRGPTWPGGPVEGLAHAVEAHACFRDGPEYDRLHAHIAVRLRMLAGLL